MGTKTKIEWCDSTINPIMGCTGCELRKDHCYAATLCARYAGCKGWPKSFDEPEFFPGRIEKALRWSDLTGKTRPDKPWLNGYPRIIFVNDLSDGFCPGVDPWQWLSPHIAAMDMSPHIWLLLTKWPNKMLEFFVERCHPIPDNFWLGTSVSQQHDKWRITELLQIQGTAVRFVSCEPLLGPVDLRDYIADCGCVDCQKHYFTDLDELILPDNASAKCPECGGEIVSFGGYADFHRQLHWVIVGGESGPGARPMNPDWARSLRDQCQTVGTPYFFKQHGAWLHESQMSDGQLLGATLRTEMGLPGAPQATHSHVDGTQSFRIGKKRAGRLLDGREHNELPSISLS